MFRNVLELSRKGTLANLNGVIMVEGEKLINEAIKSGASLRALLVETGSEKKWNQHDNVLHLLPSKLLSRLSSLETPAREIALIMLKPNEKLPEILLKGRTVVVLDRVQDPGNVGSVLRSSEALGADAVLLLKGTCSRSNPKVLRAAMGSAFRLPVFEGLDPDELLKLLKEYNYSSVGTDVEGKDLSSFKFPKKTALFFGTEGKGLFPEISRNCQAMVAVPMRPDVESLNVAATAAIFLYARFSADLKIGLS